MCESSMVRTIVWKGRATYICEACGLGYADELTARECEKFCSEKNACSVEITRKATYVPR